MRDTPKRLAHADLIIATHMEDHSDYDKVREMLSPYTQAPLVGMHYISDEDHLKEKEVGLFCGIGNPERFKEMILRMGGHIVGELIGGDHRSFPAKSLMQFAKTCKERGAEFLVCTEKDWVKLPINLRPCLPINPIKVRLVPSIGAAHWQSFIEKVRRAKDE